MILIFQNCLECIKMNYSTNTSYDHLRYFFNKYLPYIYDFLFSYIIESEIDISLLRQFQLKPIQTSGRERRLLLELHNPQH